MKGNDISTQILGWTNHQGHNYRKKVQNCILGCSVQCGGMLCYDSLLLGGGSQSPGFCSHSGRIALSESSSYHMWWWQSYTAQTWVGKGFDWWFFFSLLLHFWDGLEGSEEKCSLSQSMSHNMHSYMSSLEPRIWNEPPAIKILLPIQVSKCEAKSYYTITGRKHVLWGQLGAKLQLQNAFWRSQTMEVPQGSLSLLPQPSLSFITLPPALMGTTKWRVKRQDAGESKQDHGALFRFPPSCS